jgi:hypothetical protein
MFGGKGLAEMKQALARALFERQIATHGFAVDDGADLLG